MHLEELDGRIRRLEPSLPAKRAVGYAQGADDSLLVAERGVTPDLCAVLRSGEAHASPPCPSGRSGAGRFVARPAGTAALRGWSVLQPTA